MAKEKTKQNLMVDIAGRWYQVADMPSEPHTPEQFTKGVAYKINTFLVRGLYPYRGCTTKLRSTLEPGIWFIDIKGTYCYQLVLPTGDDKPAYRDAEIRDMVASVISGDYTPSEFKAIAVDIGEGSADTFCPPLTADDDAMNTIMKFAMRNKGAPFGPFAERFKSTVVDKKGGTDGVNAANNAKRSILQNNAMSMTKAVYYAMVMDLDIAIVVQDRKDISAYPATPDGKPLIIYPTGNVFPFNSENSTNIGAEVAEIVAKYETQTTKDKEK